MKPSNEKEKVIRRRVHAKAVLKGLTMRQAVFEALELWLKMDDGQEAEYWESHSPLDLATEPKAQKVRVKGGKDRLITVRLDSESRSKLDKLAAEQGFGPSSFARLVLMSVIEPKGR